MPDTTAPFAFVADIIIENGEVRFLELGDLLNSGLDGYDALHGGDLHTEVTRFVNNIYPVNGGDLNATLMGCCDDKGLFYALFADACPNLFPQTRIYPFYQLLPQLDTIIHDFEQHESVVFKTATDARGTGIHMRTLQDIALRPDADLIDTFTLPDANPLQPGRSIDAFARATAFNAPSHFAVQSLTKADPITHNGHPYAPVMRVVMVASPNDDGTLSLHHKGAYFKLPQIPLNQATTLSDKFLSKISDSGDGAAPVPDALYANVQNQINTHFLPALQRAYYTPATTLMQELLHSNDQGKYLVALKWLTTPNHLQLNVDEPIEHLIPRIDLIADTNPAALRFLASAANRRQSWHRKLHDVKARYRDLATQSYDGNCILSARNLSPLSNYHS